MIIHIIIHYLVWYKKIYPHTGAFIHDLDPVRIRFGVIVEWRISAWWRNICPKKCFVRQKFCPENSFQTIQFSLFSDKSGEILERWRNFSPAKFCPAKYCPIRYSASTFDTVLTTYILLPYLVQSLRHIICFHIWSSLYDI